MARLESIDSTFDATSLQPLWARLAEQSEELEAAERAYTSSQVLTTRRLDESNGAGQRAYIVANRLLLVARENQLLLEQTMQHCAVFPNATANLIRPAFEAAATALWVLDGRNAQERRLRGLRCAYEDHRQWDQWAKAALETFDPTDEQRAALMRRAGRRKRFIDRDAEQAGIDKKLAGNKVNLLLELPRLSPLEGGDQLAKHAVTVWRRLSGVQHGLAYAALATGQTLEKRSVPGGQELLLTVDDQTLDNNCRFSALMQAWATSFYIKRTMSDGRLLPRGQLPPCARSG